MPGRTPTPPSELSGNDRYTIDVDDHESDVESSNDQDEEMLDSELKDRHGPSSLFEGVRSHGMNAIGSSGGRRGVAGRKAGTTDTSEWSRHRDESI